MSHWSLAGSDEDGKKIDPNLLFDYAGFFRKLWPSKAKRHQFEYGIKTDESVFNLKVKNSVVFQLLSSKS